jgi:hypothetical protein
LSSLTAIFGNSAEKTQDSDKLMDLYWNRAELKKEFAGMRKEQWRLKDLVREQEGATARLQQKLDHLESLLVDPEWAHNVVVYYQLRGLARKCERKLARFAEQLKQQREQKKHSTVLVDWNEKRKAEGRSVEGEILDKLDRIQQLEDQLESEQHRLTSMSGMARWFRGRSVMKLVDSLAVSLEAAVQEEKGLRERLKEIKTRQPPDHQGLDIAAKRSINLMILAFAQQLYIHFADAGIAALMKEATEKSVGSVNYGNQYECAQLLETIHKAADRLQTSSNFVDVLQKRAQFIGNDARYPGESNPVPLAGSVVTLYRIDGNGLVRESEADIAGQNYWGISKIFSR